VRLARRDRPPFDVAAGERVLAWAESQAGPVGGTRDALYHPGGRIPWEQVEAADWDSDTSVLRVSEVGSWGEARPVHLFTLEEPGNLLELVRERVSASVVLQRQVRITGRHGLRVIARRAPRGDQPLSWFYEYDEGIDPTDPLVRQAAGEALRSAQDEVEPG
jgi:hypothetical protein